MSRIRSVTKETDKKMSKGLKKMFAQANTIPESGDSIQFRDDVIGDINNYES